MGLLLNRSVVLLPPGYPASLFPLEKPLRILHCAFDKDYFEKTTQRNQALELMMQKLYSELAQLCGISQGHLSRSFK